MAFTSSIKRTPDCSIRTLCRSIKDPGLRYKDRTLGCSIGTPCRSIKDPGLLYKDAGLLCKDAAL